MAAERALSRRIGKAVEFLILSAGAVVMIAAATDMVYGGQTSATEREVIPGTERMTDAERDAYRRRMEQAATPEDKAKVRAEYARTAQKKAADPVLVGDPQRGARIHGVCFSCHGIERYTAPVTSAASSFFDSVLRASGLSDEPPPPSARFRGRARSVADLRDAVNRRNELLNPKMTPQEVEDVVAYLNATYYKFPEQTARASK